jgi:hypothetical protein
MNRQLTESNTLSGHFIKELPLSGFNPRCASLVTILTTLLVPPKLIVTKTVKKLPVFCELPVLALFFTVALLLKFKK